jgi:integrase
VHEPYPTSARRALDLAGDAMTIDLLARLRLEQDAEKIIAGASYVDGGFVFASRNGSPLDRWAVSHRFFRPTIKAVGITGLRLYDLRHSMASIALSLGASPRDVAERLGHTDAGFTLATYVHSLPNAQRGITGSLVAACANNGARNEP